MDNEKLNQELARLDDTTVGAKALKRVVTVILEMAATEAGREILLTEVIQDRKLIVKDKRISKSNGEEVFIQWELYKACIFWQTSGGGSTPSMKMPDIDLTDKEVHFLNVVIRYLLNLKNEFIFDDLDL